MVTNEQRVLKLVREAGVFRSRELVPHGIPRTALSRLVQQDKVRRVGRGLYEVIEPDPTEHVDLMVISKRVPKGVICLISALNFHDMTTQMPHEVWIAIDVKAHKPKIEHPPARIVRFSGAALAFGVETYEIGGVQVRVTTPAKTVADCFKYRNKVGTDIAVEALKAFRRGRKGTMDDLCQASEICRVTKVIRPYLESLA